MWKMSSAIWIADNVANVLGSAQTRYFVLGSRTPWTGANVLAAAQGRATSSSWSASTAKKRFSAEASTGGVACISTAAAHQTMRGRRSAVRTSRRQAAAAVPSEFSDLGERLSLKLVADYVFAVCMDRMSRFAPAAA